MIGSLGCSSATGSVGLAGSDLEDLNIARELMEKRASDVTDTVTMPKKTGDTGRYSDREE
jgi:hypothetical protein